MLAAVLLTLLTANAESTSPRSADVVIYGATPAGIAAAIAAADDGRTVLLVEPTARVGGMTTAGLSHSDFRTFEGLSGAFLDFSRRVEEHYRSEHDADPADVELCFRGTHGEPKVNLAVFHAMLGERPAITVLRSCVLQSVQHETVSEGKRRIVSAKFFDAKQRETELVGRVFIDATYEGDLMAAAKVPYRVGREGRDEFGESLAPEQGDGQLQGYNFRLIMTQVPENRVALSQPAGYRREEYVALLPLLNEKKFDRVFGYTDGTYIYKAHAPHLPHGKYDINDMSRGLVRLSLPGENTGWPDGDAATRQKIFDEHLRWNVGMLYFLQHDPAVPSDYQREANSWGLCRDEFTQTDHLPPQLYVREARRMVGQHVFTQHDCEAAPNDARSALKHDSIAAGDYGPNCHGTAHEGGRVGGRHTGEFYQRVPPYQIRYGTIVPNEVENLLVPVAASSSHVGFCALRLEPIWMSLGQAAGHAAATAIADSTPVQRIDVVKLQARLHAAGSATIYVSDVPPEHQDFEAVQWWGSVGRRLLSRVSAVKTSSASTTRPSPATRYSSASPFHRTWRNTGSLWRHASNFRPRNSPRPMIAPRAATGFARLML